VSGVDDAPTSLRPRPVPKGFVLPTCPVDVATAFVAMAARGEFTLPPPGAGNTAGRFAALAEMSAIDLSLARLVEGHVDAVAILAEAGKPPPPSAVMGVWAARRPDADVTAVAQRGGWHLRGRKPWASGARLLTHALVTATGDDGTRLFQVPLRGDGVTVVPDTWPAVGMAMSESLDVDFDLVVDDDCALGPPGWYVDRPGFWFGSVGVAACWLGGALGLVRALTTDLAGRGPDGHQLAHLGAASTRCASMARDIDWAAGRIDATPDDVDRAIRAVALQVRHLTEEGCLEVVARVGRAGGAGPLCRDPAQARRFADLPVYIRQHHAERDSEALGRLIVEEERRLCR
jgi:alkylation response protein AidB-like acyl-CoA dehydrogenase